MESVIREWTRTANTVAAAGPLAVGQQVSRPSLDLKRLVNFNVSSLFQPTRLKEQIGAVSKSPAALARQPDQLDQGPTLSPQGDAFELSARSRSVPLNAIRRMNPSFANAATSRVSFEKLGPTDSTPRTSFDGNSRLGSLELARPTDQTLESCCPPHAAQSPLTVSNCHMLKFLHTSGPMLGRKESGVLRGRKYMSLASTLSPDSSEHLIKKSLLSPGNSLDHGFKLSLLDKQAITPMASLPSRGWVFDQSRSDSESSAGKPSIGSAPAQKGKAWYLQEMQCSAQLHASTVSDSARMSKKAAILLLI